MYYSRPGAAPRITVEKQILPMNKPLPMVDNDPEMIANLLRRKAKDFGLSDNDIELCEEAAKQAESDGASKEKALEAAVGLAAALAGAKHDATE